MPRLVLVILVVFVVFLASGVLGVSRGEPLRRLLLTGELDAVNAQYLVVPRTPQWQQQIRWLEAAGTQVKAGQRVAEFDSTSFANTLSEKKLAAQTAQSELLRQRAQNAVAVADKAFAVDKARTEAEKAQLKAQTPADTLPGRVYQQNQLDLEKAKVALAKASDALDAERRAGLLDIRVKEIALARTQRDIRDAEKALDDLVLRAPSDGMVIIADHPWEGRRLEVGDTVYQGWPVVRLPDLSLLEVKAQLSDVDEGRVHAGMKARCVLDAYPEQPLWCIVHEVSPVAREPAPQSLRRSFLVLLDVDLLHTDRARMLPGLSVKVEVALP